MNRHENALDRLRGWMADQGWTPLEHQEETWRAQQNGRQGLVCVPTGTGKTYAAYLGALADLADRPRPGLSILWVTPLRAMARDIEIALRRPIEELGLDVTIASRTGDTSSHRKRKLRENLPNVLLTTPESLSLMLSYEDAPTKFRDVDVVVLDEWHDVADTKRGTQTELAVARIRGRSPGLRVWALSATVGNLAELAQAAVGTGQSYEIVSTEATNHPEIRLVPLPEGKLFPWFGYLGASMFDAVVDDLDPDVATLLFTNTRSQAERWHQAIVDRRPEWADRAAVHHGSIGPDERERVENGLKDGSITVVVCTSSLDLGVDFSAVERVYQISSARSVARFLQRAGRSAHRPSATSQIRVVPTNALQLVEIEALRRAVERNQIESRPPLDQPLDVLAQHLVTCALGGGFEPDALYDEVRTAYAYRSLAREEFDWCIDLVERGGSSLRSYPNYHKVVNRDGTYLVEDAKIARMHRSSIGTITGNAQVRLRFTNGHDLGTVEEQFVARLSPGDTFVFSGRVLEVVTTHGMDVRVRVAKKSAGHVPRWVGGQMGWSDSLADAILGVLDDARRALERDPGDDLTSISDEVAAVGSVLRLQHQTSAIPRPDVVHAEAAESREGSHLFLFPFAGRQAHEGLAALLAHRLASRTPVTLALSVNELGLELHAPGGFDLASQLDDGLFSVHDLTEDMLAAVNAAELTRRHFREIARVSGLVFEGWPWDRKSTRQIQTSAGLLHDVFVRWEPDNLLLEQSRQEVLERHFDQRRLAHALERIARGIDLHRTERFSPLAFPLVVDRVEARVSSESARQRIERMKARWAEDAS